MLAPTVTGSGESVFTTDRSADPATAVAALPLLLAGSGSAVDEAAVAVLVSSVPPMTPVSTFTINVNTESPAGTEGFVQWTVPVPPTGGVVQDQPAGAASETKVVPVGNGSSRVTVAAMLGPAFVVVIV